MGSRRVLPVFRKAKQTERQGCKKVSSMNRHSSIAMPRCQNKRFHSGGLFVFIVKIFSQLSLHFFEPPLSSLSSSSHDSFPLCFFPFHPFLMPVRRGARGGRCLITHEHQQLKWSSENDVNGWHLRKCQWVFRGSNNGRKRPHYTRAFLLCRCVFHPSVTAFRRFDFHFAVQSNVASIHRGWGDAVDSGMMQNGGCETKSAISHRQNVMRRSMCP